MWNAGMFVWKTATILANLEKFLPDSTEPLQKIKTAWKTPSQQQVLNDWFNKMPQISIDYAVMEKAPEVHAVKLNCRWLDLGSLTAIADIIDSDKNGNVIIAGFSQLLDCSDNIIVTEDTAHLIVGIGLDKMVVVHTPDATLVCPLEQAQRLKNLLELVERHNGKKFL